jgi:hypothetical protein
MSVGGQWSLPYSPLVMLPVRHKRIRQLLLLYFWLLIFEGALRRWILPGLSNPLLLVRDPIALLAIWWGWPLLRQRRWRVWLSPLLVIGLIAFLLAITVGHGDLFVAAYGARILVLQLPLIFLFPAVFNRDDVIRFAWLMLALSIPMTVLIASQSNLPETHILNVGVGGVGTSVFDGAGGRFRPPGTFSFINGLSHFYTLAAASLFVVLYGTYTKQRSRLFAGVAGVALVVALPVSISRSLLAGYLQVLTATLTALTLSRTRILPLISGVLAVAVSVGVATAIPAFQDTSDAFLARWETAAGTDRAEVGDVGVANYQLQNRVLAGFTAPLANLEAVPFAGYGIGIGTNVGAQRLSGDLAFLVGEGAWEASLNELGLPLGLAFLFWRLAFALWLLRLALRQALRGNRLPLILLAASLGVLDGQLGQPTGLGFLVLNSGLTLAACNPGASTTWPSAA